jgi:hypothetical protein
MFHVKHPQDPGEWGTTQLGQKSSGLVGIPLTCISEVLRTSPGIGALETCAETRRLKVQRHNIRLWVRGWPPVPKHQDPRLDFVGEGYPTRASELRDLTVRKCSLNGQSISAWSSRSGDRPGPGSSGHRIRPWRRTLRLDPGRFRSGPDDTSLISRGPAATSRHAHDPRLAIECAKPSRVRSNESGGARIPDKTILRGSTRRMGVDVMPGGRFLPSRLNRKRETPRPLQGRSRTRTHMGSGTRVPRDRRALRQMALGHHLELESLSHRPGPSRPAAKPDPPPSPSTSPALMREALTSRWRSRPQLGVEPRAPRHAEVATPVGRGPRCRHSVGGERSQVLVSFDSTIR